MKKTKRKLITLIAVLLLIPLFSLISFAAEETEPETDEFYSEQLKSAGAYELFNLIDDDTKELLKQIGLEGFDSQRIFDLSPRKIIDMIMSIVSGGLKEPVKAAVSLIGIVILFSLISCYMPDLEGKGSIFGYVFVLAGAMIIIKPISDCIGAAISAINATSKVMLALIPILTGIIAATGKAMSALSYNGISFSAAQLASQLCNSFVAPFSGVYMALSMAGSINPMINIESIAAFIKKVTTIVLSFTGTIFAGLLTIRGILAGSVDALALKGAKFVLGTAIPVIGSSIGDALSSIIGSLQVVKSTVGVVGIIIVALINIPVIIHLLLWMLSLKGAAFASEMFGYESISKMIDGLTSGLTVIFAILCFNAVLMIVSLGIVVSMSNR